MDFQQRRVWRLSVRPYVRRKEAMRPTTQLKAIFNLHL